MHVEGGAGTHKLLGFWLGGLGLVNICVWYLPVCLVCFGRYFIGLLIVLDVWLNADSRMAAPRVMLRAIQSFPLGGSQQAPSGDA